MDDVLGRAERLGVDDSDIVDLDDPVRTLERALANDDDVLPPIFAAMTRDCNIASHALVALYLRSTRGFHQGCALGTHGACCPYHAALHSLKRDYPTTRVICFGDDTYGNDDGAVLYQWLAAKAAACRPLGHVARMDKEQCYSPTSGCPHAPASLPGSPRHPDGLISGFKGLGAFLGDDAWCRSQLARKLLKRLDHLDGIDAIRDFDDFDTARQTQHLLVDASVSSVPVYSLRVQAPHVTLGPLDDATASEVGAPTAADAVDVRVGRTLDTLTCAADTPPDLRAIAHRQMRLPKSEGGLGKTSAAELAPTAYCASRLATAARLRCWIPLFAAHDPVTDPHPYFAVFRDHYADLRARRDALAASYASLAKDVHHLCDGVTSSAAFHPPRLPEAKSLPPISSVLAADRSASVLPPKQAKLASVGHHEAWRECLDLWKAWDAAHPAAEIADRGATNFISVSQFGAGAWLDLPANARGFRFRSEDFLYAIQRRFGLYISAAIPVFAAAAAAGDRYDPWCDRLIGEPLTDKSAPHNEALRVLHDCHQATAPGTVVLGDKENVDVWKVFNEGCCLDIAERAQAAGGANLVVEVKAWCHLHPVTSPLPHSNVARRGNTHAFGGTLEHATRKVLGVRARDGTRPWDHATGTGSVAYHPGDYDDAIRRKRNAVILFLLEITGAMSPPAKRHLRWLQKRAKRNNGNADRTHYEGWAARTRGTARPFMQHWTQRLSAATVMGDARRALNALRACAVRFS